MKHRFRDKLIAAFLALLLITVAPVLILVNTQIERISEAKITQDLDTTRKVFERVQAGQLASYSERARTFILTQPDVRAEIASTDVATEAVFEQIFSTAGVPFPAAAPAGGGAEAAGAAGSGLDPEALEQQNRIRSVVQEVSLYGDAALFFLADFKGELIFSKTAAAAPHVALAELPVVRAALQGRETFTWWVSTDPRLAGLALLPVGADGGTAPALYQMFFKPVEFDGEVKGLLGIGFALSAADTHRITAIAQADVAFVAGGTVYQQSRPDVPAADLLGLLTPPATPGAGGPRRFTALDEEFLALPVPVLSTLGEPVGTVLVYRSKTQEQRVFEDLRRVLNAIGLAALLAAALLAYGISHSVSRVVRQLFHGVSAVRQGDLDVRLAIRSRDEFGELGRAFNEMTAGLKEKETIRSTFKRYVSSTVVDELLRGGTSIKLGGEAKQLTIQFSDIAGFTALSESLSPEQVVEFLNTYLSRMTAEVEAEGGIVDKYIGDAVMAFWGAPLPVPAHADHACRAALRQMRQVAELRTAWSGRGDLSRFSVRIGLHSGEVVVGNIGSDTRMDYTIVGDSVNTASRLEGMNKVYGTSILISEDTFHLLEGRYVTRELDQILAVGKARPVRIFELAGEDGEVPAERRAVHERFAEGLALYRARRFTEAAAIFGPLATDAGDAPSRTFLRRCEELQVAPPPEGWTGIYQSLSK